MALIDTCTIYSSINLSYFSMKIVFNLKTRKKSKAYLWLSSMLTARQTDMS